MKNLLLLVLVSLMITSCSKQKNTAKSPSASQSAAKKKNLTAAEKKDAAKKAAEAKLAALADLATDPILEFSANKDKQTGVWDVKGLEGLEIFNLPEEVELKKAGMKVQFDNSEAKTYTLKEVAAVKNGAVAHLEVSELFEQSKGDTVKVTEAKLEAEEVVIQKVVLKDKNLFAIYNLEKTQLKQLVIRTYKDKVIVERHILTAVVEAAATKAPAAPEETEF
jgi:hypothetical protein